MRIFERLRGWGRRNSSFELKLFGTIAGSFLAMLEEETTAPVLAMSSGSCRSCCSADDRTADRHQG
jgi:hypothetical protein